jgi:phosphoribosylformylglycinamidine cyclo-ligase
MIGEPFALEGGFSGALDFGDFLLVQNDDGVGTKSEIAERTGVYETLGEDLLCMVADDAICVGAETVSITNTLDVPVVEPEIIESLTSGLAEACGKEKVVIPGGEIAEVGDACNKMVWNATAVGVVKKDRFISGKNVKVGQKIIGLRGRVLRSNGISLARKICEMSFGEDWHNIEWKDGITWGQVLLTPSKIFHRLILDNVIGGFDSDRPFNVSGIVHITGGGIPGNVPRIFPNKSLGAKFDNLHEPHKAIKDLQKLGNIDEKECYKTWNCGTALMIFCDEQDANAICEKLNSADNEVDAKIVGEVNDTQNIEIISKFTGTTLLF